MFFILRFLIDAAILGFLLAVVGHVDVASDFMRPLAVIFLTAVVSIVVSLLLGGILWGIPAFAIVVAALYLLVGWFFDITRRKKIIIVATYLIVQIAMAFVL